MMEDKDMMHELMQKNRTIRRFDQSKPVTGGDLNEILSVARLSASAANLQRIRYMTLSGESAQAVFPFVSMGGYLPSDKRPDRTVSPTAYIVILVPNKEPDVNLSIDVGIAAEVITLAAAEKGIGACMIRNFRAEAFLPTDTGIQLYPCLVIALGFPSEEARVVNVSEDASIKYYKDEQGVNCVPKRSLAELIIEERA